MGQNKSGMGAGEGDSEYDFIIVGGGTSGCLLAHRLSHAATRPKVLLLEAGPVPDGKYLYEPFHRYTPSALRPDLNWGYSTVPQKELGGRQIPYPRGKVLGGSSIFNFGVYLYGSQEDFNRWADLVGDDSWKWEQTKRSFHAIENYDFEAANQYPHLAKPDLKDHGSDGPVRVCLPPALEDGLEDSMKAVLANGEKLNLDANSGDPIGVSLFPNSYSKDGRTTSANAHLIGAPDNLTVWTASPVHKLLFEGQKVIGIETEAGHKTYANKEVILSGGFVDTPKLLLLNGIGPAKELEDLGISVVKDLPGVGKQFNDHLMTWQCVEVDTKQNNRYAFETSEQLLKEAEEAWARDKSGAFSIVHSTLWGGFLKVPGLEGFPEFKALAPDLQEYLSREKTPTYEFICNCILWPPGTMLPEDSSYLTTIAFLMNPQSRGSVTLSSADPKEAPILDPHYLEHPYDKRIMREAIRATWTKVYESPEIKKHIKGTIHGPKSLSDEHLDEFARETVTTVWHGNGTAMMGKPENPLACVDSSFRVYGVQGLRVADLSVCPFSPNNHPQSTAYLVGQKAAEKLIAEYGL